MLRRVMIGVGMTVIAVGLLGPVSAGAGTDCKRILKFLSTGRTVQDIAETMMIDESQIEECQAEAAKEKAAQPAGGGAVEKKEEAAPAH